MGGNGQIRSCDQKKHKATGKILDNTVMAAESMEKLHRWRERKRENVSIIKRI